MKLRLFGRRSIFSFPGGSFAIAKSRRTFAPGAPDLAVFGRVEPPINQLRQPASFEALGTLIIDPARFGDELMFSNLENTSGVVVGVWNYRYDADDQVKLVAALLGQNGVQMLSVRIV